MMTKFSPTKMFPDFFPDNVGRYFPYRQVAEEPECPSCHVMPVEFVNPGIC